MNRVYPEHTQTAQLVGHLDNQTTGVDRHWHSPPNPQTNSTTSWAPWQSAPCSRPSDHLAQSPPRPPKTPQTAAPAGHHDKQKPGVDNHLTQSTQPINQTPGVDHLITWHSPPTPTNRPLELIIWSPDTVHPTHQSDPWSWSSDHLTQSTQPISQTPGVDHLITWHSPPNPQTDPWSQPSDHLTQSTQPTDWPLELIIWSPDTVPQPTDRPLESTIWSPDSPPNPQTDPWSWSSDHLTQSPNPQTDLWSCSSDQQTQSTQPTDPWSQPSDHLAQSTQPTDRPLESTIWSPDTVNPTHKQTATPVRHLDNQTPGVDHPDPVVSILFGQPLLLHCQCQEFCNADGCLQHVESTHSHM